MFTILLVIINIFIFLLTSQDDNLIYKYGMTNSNMHDSMIWITSMFIHANYIHIISNMIALLDFGLIIEKKYGSFKFILLYFISGLVSSLLSYLYLFNNSVLVIGASGAIFGLWAFLYLMEGKYWSFLFLSIGINIIMIAINMPIAWFAHLGGAIAGTIIGFIYKKVKNENK